MIKKVKIEQLRPGIFIHDFNTDLNSHNILLNPTLVKSTKIINILHEWGIREVYIDTDKGEDVVAARPAAEAQRRTDSALQELAKSMPATPKNAPLQEEIAVAKKIKKQATNVLLDAMAQVRKGEPLETENAYHLIEDMEKSVTRNRDALVLLTRIRNKDEYTLMHSVSVGAYILNFCNFFEIPRERTISLAVGALFHDIGKTRIPLTILNKPGKLTDQEFDEMRRHTLYSAEILSSAKNLPSEAYDMGLHHHERYDGTGYPHKLKADEIGPGSQLAAIADVYDAITSDRCYHSGMDRVAGLRKLYEWSEHHFNKDLTHKFIRCIGVYPIGTCVKLGTGKIGVVVGTTENLVQPLVRIFYDDNLKVQLPMHDLDLSLTGDNVTGYEDPAKWNLKALNIFEEITAELLPGS